MKFVNFIIVIVMINLCCSNENPIDSDESIADAGPDRNTTVGCYIKVSGANSKPGKNSKITYYEWGQSEMNTNQINVYIGGNSPDNYLAFDKPGRYMLFLKIHENEVITDIDWFEVIVSERENIIFEDPIFEAIVRMTLENPDKPISADDLAAMDNLPLVSYFGKTKSISGIEACTNLESVSLAFQNVSDISELSKLHKLKRLSLSQIRLIKDVTPLQNLTNLEFLDLDSNEIEDISALKNLINLSTLIISGNPIKSISTLAYFKNLEEIWMSSLPKIDGDISCLAELKKLNTVWAGACNVTEISVVKELPNLSTLFLKYNQIVDISSLQNHATLSRIYLSYNNIVDISPLRTISNISLLKLDHNKIEDLKPLVDNPGIGEGDVIILHGNPLSEKSLNEFVPALINRGVLVN